MKTAFNRLREPTHLIKNGTPMNALTNAARTEVEAFGWITTETATKLRRCGVDVAAMERRLLDA